MIKEITNFQFEGKKTTMLITDEYHRFKFIEGNRNPELASGTNAHARQIMESIKEHGYLLNFVKVNEDWGIVDGQHSFTALRELQLPVYVVKIHGYHDREIQIRIGTNLITLIFGLQWV